MIPTTQVGPAALRWHHAPMGKVTVMMTQIVEVCLSVDLIIARVVPLAWTVAQVDVQGTMTATMKKLAIMPTVSVGRGQTIHISPSATKASSAQRVRVDVIPTQNVKVSSCVAPTTVQVDHQAWTVVQGVVWKIMIVWTTKFATLMSDIADRDQTIPMMTFAANLSCAMKARETATGTMNVTDHWCVTGIFVQRHAQMTLIAVVLNAMLKTIYVVLIPLVLIGRYADKASHVMTVKVIVMMIQNVQDLLCAVLAIAQVDI